jgi:SsrA-binding protein
VKPYQAQNNFSPNPRRDRVLLLNKNEILKLKQKTEQKGLTIVPVRAYLKGRLLKLEIALAQGKKNYNKKETIKERDILRDTNRRLADG